MGLPEYLSGGRIQGRSDDSSLTAIPQTSWKELARSTLSSSTSSNIDTGTFTAKDNLMFLVESSDSSTNSDLQFTFNSDTGSNYASRDSENGGSENTLTSQTASRIGCETNDPSFCVGSIRNTASNEKLLMGYGTYATAGAGNAGQRKEAVGKWANTSNQITSVQLRLEGNNIQSPAELVVLGCDDDEADSGTNYWQELAVKELTSAGDTIDTGTFTAKKYLKVAIHINSTSAVRTQFQFNSDTGSNYANRNSKNGGTDSTNTGMGRIYLNDHESSSDSYAVAYIINVGSKEKLIIYEDMWQNVTGTGTAPLRTETVAKWANTSDQITSIQLLNDKAGDFLSGSSIRVWGAN